MHALRVEASPKLPCLAVSDGSVEGLKWLALLAMTGDHVNKFLFNGTLPFLFEAGRLALPIFVFVLAHNLARLGTLERGVYGRTMLRLLAFGALATVPYIAFGGLYAGWWPLNVMFTLFVITATAYLLERGRARHLLAAGAMFGVGGSLVEFWWPAVAFGLAVWAYSKRPSLGAVAAALLSFVALGYEGAALAWLFCTGPCQVDPHPWAFAAVPVLLLASRMNLRVPRLRWAFYAYYPLHLAAIWLTRIPMSKAGYLFF